MNIYVFCISKNTRGAQVKSGDTLYLDELPKLNGKPDWTFELDAGELEGKIRLVSSINGQNQQQDWSPPYTEKSLPTTPGIYTLSYVATKDGTGEPTQFGYTIVQSRPANPTTEIAQPFELGWNIGGDWASNSRINDTGLNLQQYVIDIAPIGHASYFRGWQTTRIDQAPPASEFVMTNRMAGSGIKPIMVFNLQNNPKRCYFPDDLGDAYVDGLPPAKETGIWGIEWVNEHDYSPMYNQDTKSRFAMSLMRQGPKLIAKGYNVIASNALRGNGWYVDPIIIPALKPQFVTHIGKHAYDNNADSAIAEHKSCKALADSYGLHYCATEVGLHNANWNVEVPKLWAGLKQLGGIYCGFTFYGWDDPKGSEYANNPYSSPGKTNSLFDALKKVLGAA